MLFYSIVSWNPNSTIEVVDIVTTLAKIEIGLGGILNEEVSLLSVQGEVANVSAGVGEQSLIRGGAVTKTLRARLREVRQDLELSRSSAASPTGTQKSPTLVGGPSRKSLKSTPMSARSMSTRASFFRKKKFEMSATPVDESAIPMEILPTLENVAETEPVNIRVAMIEKETANIDEVMTDIIPDPTVTERRSKSCMDVSGSSEGQDQSSWKKRKRKSKKHSLHPPAPKNRGKHHHTFQHVPRSL